MDSENETHKRWNSRLKRLENVGTGLMAATLGNWIEAGESAPETLAGYTLEDLEDMRRMTMCPASDSGWPAHADCREEADYIDWLMLGVVIVRDDAGNWEATGKDGAVLKMWKAGEGKAE